MTHHPHIFNCEADEGLPYSQCVRFVSYRTGWTFEKKKIFFEINSVGYLGIRCF